MQKSFKERVKEETITNSRLFKEFFVDYEYLICSDGFEKNPYYIIGAHVSNYKHLIGVSSEISAEEFFNKSINCELKEEDFEFIKRGQSESAVKGSVRRKINVLPNLFSLFENEAFVEEDFIKNKIKCTFAVGKNECTLGFTSSLPSKPQSLLKGNQLDLNKAKKIELVLRRAHGEKCFDEIIYGDFDSLSKYISKIDHLLSERLIETSSK